jgi:hypothetical protein
VQGESTTHLLFNLLVLIVPTIKQDYGVKANLKTEALIDLVLDATKFVHLLPTRAFILTSEHSQPMPKPEPVPQSQPPPSRRTASIRVASTRSTNVAQSRLRSGSSMVIREAEEEEESTAQHKTDTSKIPQPTTQTRAAQSQPAPPITRTRKAKETQLRLGVGRPKVAGGVGARAVTKSFSVPKNNKRVSKNIKTPQTTIPEEQDSGM